MAGWTNIPDGNLEPGSPIRSADGLALRENPIAIAERANNAPRVAPNSYQKLFNSGTFTVPDGVTRICIWLVGAGAGGDDGGSPTDGGNTSMAGYTATGGNAGSGGDPGAGVGGKGNYADGQGGGYQSAGGSSGLGTGGGGRNTSPSSTDGGGGGAYNNSGGGGGCERRVINVTPGQGISYSCGAGGNGTGTNGGNGGDGFIIVEY